MSATQSWFQSLSIEMAPAGSRDLVAASTRQLGFLASPVARAAHSPALLGHLLAGFVAFDKTSLSHAEREVIAMTVAYEHECHYCMALHTAINAGKPELAPMVEALRSGTALPDTRLEALRAFAQVVLRERAHVPPSAMNALAAAGFSEAQALDAMLGIGVYVLSTFVNIVTRAPLDPPFATFAWSRPA